MRVIKLYFSELLGCDMGEVLCPALAYLSLIATNHNQLAVLPITFDRLQAVFTPVRWEIMG